MMIKDKKVYTLQKSNKIYAPQKILVNSIYNTAIQNSRMINIHSVIN